MFCLFWILFPRMKWMPHHFPEQTSEYEWRWKWSFHISLIESIIPFLLFPFFYEKLWVNWNFSGNGGEFEIAALACAIGLIKFFRLCTRTEWLSLLSSLLVFQPAAEIVTITLMSWCCISPLLLSNCVDAVSFLCYCYCCVDFVSWWWHYSYVFMQCHDI